MPEYTFSNRGQTTLTGAIAADATSISVSSAATFPTTGPYIIVVDDGAGHIEYMKVTAGYGTTTWTVARQVESASRYPAYAFGAGATVRQVVSAEILDRLQNVPMCRLTRTNAYSLASASDYQWVAFENEVYDTHDFWSSSDPTKIYIPSGYSGRYQVAFSFTVGSGWAGTLELYVDLRRSATNWLGSWSTSFGPMQWGARAAIVWPDIEVSGGDYLQIKILQYSDNTRTIEANYNGTPLLTVRKVG